MFSCTCCQKPSKKTKTKWQWDCAFLADIWLSSSWENLRHPKNMMWVARNEKSEVLSHKRMHFQTTAFMNLMANIVDNAAHGLAVGSSFLVSTKVSYTFASLKMWYATNSAICQTISPYSGYQFNFQFGIMTTITILLHEIPHEIGDFAILVRADIGRKKAMCLQVFNPLPSLQKSYFFQFITALAGVVGAGCALSLHTSNIPVISTLLPFTAGGFLNIALTELLPELNEEDSPL